MKFSSVIISFYLLNNVLTIFISNDKVIDHNRFNDSIQFWFKESKNKRLTLEKRNELLDKCYNVLINKDVYKNNLKLLSEITYQTLLLKDTLTFLDRNKKVIQLAEKREDSFILGDAYWNYATLDLGKREYEHAFKSFQKAEKYFINIPFYKAKMLIGKAFIKGRYSDYLGAEQDLAKAIKIFEELEKYNDLISCYVSLSNIQLDLELFSKSEDYLNKALSYSKYLDDFDSNQLLNNLALIYQKKKEYRKSIELFSGQLELINKEEKPNDYARLLDNLNYSKFLNKDTTGVKKAFYRSLKIRDSLNNREGVLMAKVHLSEYFQRFKDTVNALKYAMEANRLALSLKNSREILNTYKMLSVLDPKRSDSYLNKYIQYSDSLVSQERSYRNKLARIELDTDFYIEENEQLAEEKTWIIVIGITVITLLISLYNLILQRRKTEKLVLEKEQEELNKELYQLSIDQQKRIQLEKSEEQKRISEELHDGVLGKLFGTRLGLGFLNVKLKKEEKLKFDNFIEDLQTIEKEIRDVSHQLNSSSENYTADFNNLIKELLIEKSRIGDFEYQFNEESIDWNTINENIKLNCYRILQEGLSNVIKHAKATKVELTVESKNNTLSILLSDNGKGFQTSLDKKGIGLKNIKSRVKKCRGKLTIESTENKGTQLSIEIPIKK